MLVYYPIIILKMPDILTLIANYEELIGKSKWASALICAMSANSIQFRIELFHFSSLGMLNSILASKYTKFSADVELGSEILYFMMTKLSVVGYIAPHLLLTIGNYFIYELGDESYVLPCPMM